MKMNKLFAIATLSMLTFMAKAQITVSNADFEENLTYTWTSDTEYVLDGLVFVKPGSTLFIESGTVIKGREIPSTGDLISMLIISKGAKIQAIGTPTCPIIFTSEIDDVNDPNDLLATDNGLWGGVAILGAGIIGDEQSTNVFLNTGAAYDTYGGDNNEDNSGTMQYVSIRHGGASFIPGNEVNGLTLAAVGKQTIIEHIETYANQDDGFEFLGGAVDARYLVAAYNKDDAFDFDLGYVGRGQFWFGLAPEGDSDCLIEGDGAQPDNNAIYSKPVLSHLTLVGNTDSDLSEQTILFRDASGGALYNSIVTRNKKGALSIESRGDTSDSYNRLLNGELIISNNIWFDFTIGTTPETFITTSPDDPVNSLPAIVDHFNTNNNTHEDPLLTSICYAGIDCVDPRPQNGSPALTGATTLSDPFFEAADYRGAFGVDNWAASWSALYTTQTSSACNNLELGKITVQIDGNDNCTPDAGEQGFAGQVIKIITPGSDYYVATDNEGVYEGVLPGDATSASIEPSNYLWSTCQANLPLQNIGTPDAVNAAFAVEAIYDCPLMTVDLSTPFLRRCFENNYFVQYCNDGTITAEDAYVDIVFNDFMEVNTASVPSSLIEGNTYRFEVGDVPAGICESFLVNFTLSCDAELGTTQCTSAEIFPDTICNPNTLEAPEISIQVECVDNEVLFTITNISEFIMDAPASYIVIEDHVMLQEEGGTFQLAPGESMVIALPANGSTFHLQTARNPGVPELGVITQGIESCGANMNATTSQGFLAGFDIGQGSFNTDTDCQANIGAFDPNDKTAYPRGIQAEQYLRANTDLSYRIRFQNTGTDTAFKVVIVDTLSEQLDLASIELGVASHTYNWSLQGRTLTFTFDNIMLPDSNVNEPASHGFVNLKISQMPDLANGNIITNFADIYFDFNDPIRTNEVFHTIGQPLEQDVLNNLVELYPDFKNIKVFPNPFTTQTTFELETFVREGQLTIFDVRGRVIQTQVFEGKKLEYNQSLNTGIYFFRIESAGQLIGAGKLMVQ